jgi:hypothetical protein
MPPSGREAPKGQIPTRRNETLRQKDCNLIQSWKDPGCRLGHRRGQIPNLLGDNLSGSKTGGRRYRFDRPSSFCLERRRIS